MTPVEVAEMVKEEIVFKIAIEVGTNVLIAGIAERERKVEVVVVVAVAVAVAVVVEVEVKVEKILLMPVKRTGLSRLQK